MEVVDSALLSPHNSFVNCNQHYLLTVSTPDAGLVKEIEQCFKRNQHHALPHINEWRKDRHTFTVNTLSMPRLPKGMDSEYDRGSLVWFAAKPDLVIGAEACIERLLLVAINNPPAWEDEAYWQQMPEQQYSF